MNENAGHGRHQNHCPPIDHQRCADSDPEDEFQETVNKAMALLRASEMASRGSVVPSQSAINGLLEGVDPSFLEAQR